MRSRPEVFSEKAGLSNRLYELSREVIEFQKVVKTLTGILSGLTVRFEKYGIDPKLQRYLRDVQDHAIRVTDLLVGFRHLLQDIPSANLLLVGLQHNEEVKALTGVSIDRTTRLRRSAPGQPSYSPPRS
jgi:magnesium transporter